MLIFRSGRRSSMQIVDALDLEVWIRGCAPSSQSLWAVRPTCRWSKNHGTNPCIHSTGHWWSGVCTANRTRVKPWWAACRTAPAGQEIRHQTVVGRSQRTHFAIIGEAVGFTDGQPQFGMNDQGIAVKVQRKEKYSTTHVVVWSFEHKT